MALMTAPVLNYLSLRCSSLTVMALLHRQVELTGLPFCWLSPSFSEIFLVQGGTMMLCARSSSRYVLLS